MVTMAEGVVLGIVFCLFLWSSMTVLILSLGVLKEVSMTRKYHDHRSRPTPNTVRKRHEPQTATTQSVFSSTG